MTQYKTRKIAVTDTGKLLALELVEESIATDPFHRQHRQQIGDVVWDKSDPTIALAYRVEGRLIVFVTFVLLSAA